MNGKEKNKQLGYKCYNLGIEISRISSAISYNQNKMLDALSNVPGNKTIIENFKNENNIFADNRAKLKRLQDISDILTDKVADYLISGKPNNIKIRFKNQHQR